VLEADVYEWKILSNPRNGLNITTAEMKEIYRPDTFDGPSQER
jgi:hypothetical protein